MKEYKVEVNERGDVFWYNLDGYVHREEGPAIETVYGTKQWYKDGKLHREDGPALEWPNGRQWWYNGKLHRLDGPAKEWVHGGNKEYWIGGKQITEEEFFALTKPKTLALTAGKFYKSKDGEKWCCFNIELGAEEHHAAWCIRTRDHRVEYFYIDGRYDTAGMREHTLVEEWNEPSDLAKEFLIGMTKNANKEVKKHLEKGEIVHGYDVCGNYVQTKPSPYDLNSIAKERNKKSKPKARFNPNISPYDLGAIGRERAKRK